MYFQQCNRVTQPKPNREHKMEWPLPKQHSSFVFYNRLNHNQNLMPSSKRCSPFTGVYSKCLYDARLHIHVHTCTSIHVIMSGDRGIGKKVPKRETKTDSQKESGINIAWKWHMLKCSVWPFAKDQYNGQVGVSLFGVCYRNTFLASRNRSLEPRLSTLAQLK